MKSESSSPAAAEQLRRNKLKLRRNARTIFNEDLECKANDKVNAKKATSIKTSLFLNLLEPVNGFEPPT